MGAFYFLVEVKLLGRKHFLFEGIAEHQKYQRYFFGKNHRLWQPVI